MTLHRPDTEGFVSSLTQVAEPSGWRKSCGISSCRGGVFARWFVIDVSGQRMGPTFKA